MCLLSRFTNKQLLLTAACVCLSLSCPAQETTVVNLSDNNGSIAISGRMVFTTEDSEATPYSFKIKASAENVSHFQALFFKVVFPFSSDTSPDAAPEVYEHDYFFSPHVLEPRSTCDFEVSLAHYGSRAASSPSPRVRAAARLVFAQFTNGKTWGDHFDDMSDIVKVRKVTTYELNLLKDAFEESGDAGFVSEITRTQYSTPALSALQHVYKEEGLEKAKTTAWSMLESAEHHLSQIKWSRLSDPLF